MDSHYQPPTFDASRLPAWAQEHAQRALDLLPQGLTIRSAVESGNSAVNLTIIDADGAPLGHLVVFPTGTMRDAASASNLHLRQIAVRRGDGVTWVTLGKPLDPQLAGRSNAVVVRIEKNGGYDVTTVCRGTGRPQQFRFSEDQVPTVRLGLDP